MRRQRERIGRVICLSPSRLATFYSQRPRRPQRRWQNTPVKCARDLQTTASPRLSFAPPDPRLPVQSLAVRSAILLFSAVGRGKSTNTDGKAGSPSDQNRVQRKRAHPKSQRNTLRLQSDRPERRDRVAPSSFLNNCGRSARLPAHKWRRP
jgi:hypothetical protein